MKYNFGLLGHEISYSLSPEIHEHIGKVINKDIQYDLLDVKENLIKSIIQANKYQGYNITKPYKKTLLSYVDALSDVAKATEAINTIYMKDGLLIGDNTDVYGFEYLLDYYRIDVRDKHVLILGTGGASKAVAYVLRQRGAFYHYASRNNQKQLEAQVIEYDKINPYLYDIYINATPIGTAPNIEDCVLEKEQVTNQLVIDLIYRPKVTKLMSYAQKAYNGYIMLLAQAIKSEMLWLNQDLNIHDILDTVKEVISYE